ncbi:rhomboid family intramembrane serine protease [Thermosipho ferrireducens]|uniref:Rhomboid family intramembrane serine protease n=1 Tax=Thermosipho ferrireducens TaxID=2571116 RepID=A0ABX7S7P1_9BACT|nr:rhomboid family intramembrane serine protease [Thermosipho ferrireducens]QTA38606.1 rhomboid family intramembrane serine protease [Thermosipho ferrireducens]
MFPLYDTIPSRKKPYITYAIIVVNVLVFLYELSLRGYQLDLFFYNYGVIPLRYTWKIAPSLKLMAYWRAIEPSITSGSLVPLISHMFIHGGWSHIIGNMWFLWIFGDNIEDRMGHFKYFLFYLSGGIFAMFFYTLFNLYSPYPMIGASGAVSAVMGAYFVQFYYSKIVTLVIWFIPFLIEIPAIVYLFFWFLFQVLNGTFSNITGSGVAYWAHVGGFIYGMVIGRMVRKRYYW